ncbi:hypothetical protein AX16_006072 [Volvariella volvacea WC 439]|nr:hypothetical protein AX16_006072 [Volvariella volvacea WC 439]
MSALMPLSALHKAEDIDTIRAQIDADISQLESQPLQLRIRQNALIPIMRLPAESTPLTVNLRYCKFDEDYWKEVIPLLSGIMGRVAVLECVDDADNGVTHQMGWDPDYMLDFSTSPLNDLSVRMCSQLYRPWKPSFRLQHLTVTGDYLHLEFISASLVTLAIRHPDLPELPFRSEFFRTLSSMTNLRYLQLARVFSALATRYGQDEIFTGNISFPSLLTLKILMEYEMACSQFLSCSNFPALKQFYFAHERTQDTSLSLLTETLIAILPKTSILHSASHDMRLHFDVSEGENTVNLSPGDSEPSLSLTWQSSAGVDDDSVRNLLDLFLTIKGLGVLFLPFDVYLNFFDVVLLSCDCVRPPRSSHEPTTTRDSVCQALKASPEFFPGLQKLEMRICSVKEFDQKHLDVIPDPSRTLWEIP